MDLVNCLAAARRAARLRGVSQSLRSERAALRAAAKRGGDNRALDAAVCSRSERAALRAAAKQRRSRSDDQLLQLDRPHKRPMLPRPTLLVGIGLDIGDGALDAFRRIEKGSPTASFPDRRKRPIRLPMPPERVEAMRGELLSRSLLQQADNLFHLVVMPTDDHVDMVGHDGTRPNYIPAFHNHASEAATECTHLPVIEHDRWHLERLSCPWLASELSGQRFEWRWPAPGWLSMP